jgi:hypothetical protein
MHAIRLNARRSNSGCARYPRSVAISCVEGNRVSSGDNHGKNQDVPGTKGSRRSLPLKCSNLARGESMKDPASVLGCWRGFSFGSAAQLKPTYKRSNEVLFFLALEPPDLPIELPDLDIATVDKLASGFQGPPHLFRPRSVCTKPRDHLHRSSKPDRSAWCPPSSPETTHGGTELAERRPCRNRMEPVRLRAETIEK